MYAIVDIETTGGSYNEEGITEIAIYKYNGFEIVDQFISLINPERDIQPFVVNLTGINSNMLKNAPKFHEVAKRIIEITTDCIIVAHNSAFDFRILHTEFSRLGYDYVRPTLCTVELSKKLIPDQPAYSLGKLTRALGIPIADRHRASGDAFATVKLFKLLLDKDVSKHIIQEAIKLRNPEKIATKYLDILEHLPSETGLYYIHNNQGEIIYVGKSNNIKKRVNQHLTDSSSKSKKMQLLIDAVSYETTGNELIALLKENEAIKQIKPLLNRALKRTKFTHALFSFTDAKGYLNLNIDVAQNAVNPITTFNNYQSAKSFLFKAVETFNLCQKLTGISTNTKSSCFSYTLKTCNGACLGEELPESYNARVTAFLNTYSYGYKNFALIDKGRSIEERSAILIEDGVFKGIAYFDLNYQIKNLTILKSILTPMQNQKDTAHIIQSYMRKNKSIKLIPFH